MKSPIQYLREKAKLSRAELAKALDVSYSTLTAWELGTFKTLSTDSLFRVAKFFNVDPDWLLREYEKFRKEMLDHDQKD
jgi:transcriptional regulator with XRE-family HTH domain